MLLCKLWDSDRSSVFCVPASEGQFGKKLYSQVLYKCLQPHMFLREPHCSPETKVTKIVEFFVAILFCFFPELLANMWVWVFSSLFVSPMSVLLPVNLCSGPAHVYLMPLLPRCVTPSLVSSRLSPVQLYIYIYIISEVPM